MTPEDAREFPSPEEAAEWREFEVGTIERLDQMPANELVDTVRRHHELSLRLADAYTVVVEVAERLGDGWYPDEAYGVPVWSLDVHDSTRDEYVAEYEPMPPAHAAFLRSIREPQEMRADDE